MRRLVWDAETIPLPLEDRAFAIPTETTVKYGNSKTPEAKAKVLQKALDAWPEGAGCALDPIAGRIAVIGFLIEGEVVEDGEEPDSQVKFLDCKDEAKILEEFFAIVRELHPVKDEMVGHNVFNFDIPFVMHRAMILGVRLPGTLVSDFMLHPSKRQLSVDTMAEWGFGKPHEYVKLERLCGAFGIKVKESAVTGEFFYKWWAEDKPACLEYLADDVNATRALWERMRGQYGEEE